MSSDQDKHLLAQLPLEVRRDLYTKFLYKVFLEEFSHVFQFEKDPMQRVLIGNDPNKSVDVRIEHSVYTFQDQNYLNFIIKVLDALEPFQYEANQLIYRELDEVNEMTFVEKGEYKIGYEINKQQRFKMIQSKHICFKYYYLKVGETAGMDGWNFYGLVRQIGA